MKKVLFVNPAIAEHGVPSTGLAMLSAILKQNGHAVKVADYCFSSRTPAIEEVLDDVRPDIAGISLFSCTMPVADPMIDAINKRGIPLLCGGPHAAAYHEELSADRRFDHIFVGEAEYAIVDAVEGSGMNKMPRVIQCPLPDVDKLPLPEYGSFYDCGNIDLYPIITSRGCPYNCSFCSVKISNSRTWRTRSLDSCIEELEKVRHEFPKAREVIVWDDNFSLDIERAKEFLRMFLGKALKYKLNIANVRADRIDREFLLLLKQAGCEEVQFGIEHGNPEVFRHIGKSETLEDIRRGAKLVNDCGMKLGCSFIIGLPYDSLKRTLDSVRFAKELKASHVHWNMLVPCKGTDAYQYFKEKGEVDDRHIPSSIPEDVLSFESNISTTSFTREERRKAYLMALLLTGDSLLLRSVKRTFLKALEYNLILELFAWIFNPRIFRDLAWRIKARFTVRNAARSV